jgi:hypothetical protein
VLLYGDGRFVPFFFVLLLVFCFAVILVIVVGEVINGIGDYGEV